MTTVAFRRPTLLEIDPWWVPDVGFSKMRVTSPFGERARGFHGGLDIGNARLGDVLLATASGRVIAAGFVGRPWTTTKPSDAWWYSQPATPDGKRGGLFGPPSRWTGTTYGGRMVVIEHAAGVVSIWAHLATVDVAVGDQVVAWERIGTVGDSGSAYRQGHTHFGVQAPAAAVPAGVETHETALGYGLDVDPWPLITGQVALTIQEDDMLGERTRPVTPYRVVTGQGSAIRTDTTLGDASLHFRTTRDRNELTIIGEIADGDAAGGPTPNLWLVYLVAGYGLRTIHSSICERLATPAPDCTDAVAAANGRTEALRQDSIEHLEGLKASTGAAIDRAIADLRAP